MSLDMSLRTILVVHLIDKVIYFILTRGSSCQSCGQYLRYPVSGYPSIGRYYRRYPDTYPILQYFAPPSRDTPVTPYTHPPVSTDSAIKDQLRYYNIRNICNIYDIRSQYPQYPKYP